MTNLGVYLAGEDSKILEKTENSTQDYAVHSHDHRGSFGQCRHEPLGGKNLSIRSSVEYGPVGPCRYAGADDGDRE